MRDISVLRGSKRLSSRMMHSVGGRGNGLLRKAKGPEIKKKRRLVLDESDPEDYMTSGEIGEHGSVACLDSGEKSFEGTGVNGNQRCRQSTNRLSKHVMLGMQRKSNDNASLEGPEHDAAANKKAKLELFDVGKGKIDGTDTKKVVLDSVRVSIGKALMRASRSPCLGKTSEDDQNHCPSRSPKIIKTTDCGIHSSDSGKLCVSIGEGVIEDHEKYAIEEVLHHDEKSNDPNFISMPIQRADAKESSPFIEDTRFMENLHSAETNGNFRPSNSDYSKKNAPICYLPSEERKTPRVPLQGLKKSNGHEKFFSKEASEESGSTDLFDDADEDLLFFQGRKHYKKLASSPPTYEITRTPKDLSCPDRRIQTRHILAEERGTPRSIQNVGSLSSSPSLSEAQNQRKKPSSFKYPKNRMQPNKLASSDKSKCLDSLSSKMESDGKGKMFNSVHSNTEVNKFKGENPVSSKTGASSGNVSHKTEKQALRDRLKGLLLHAGWKIDMRPRKGRNYEDCVYISPEGSGYWSITKAYSVLQEKISKIDNPDNKEAKEEEFANSSNELVNQFSAIPVDMVGMLKRKRSTKNRKITRAESSSVNKKSKGVMNSKSTKITKVAPTKKEINDGGVVGYSRKKKKNRRGIALLARNNNKEADSGGDCYVPYAGGRSILSWLIDSGTISVNGKVKYMNKRRTKVMMEGLITRDGIVCKCCSKTITVLEFEDHAGSKMKQPYENIFLQGSGVSLLQCQVAAWKSQDESKRCAIHLASVTEEDPNDDTCAICGDGGNLICCDSCPATFHLSCLGIKTPPPGDWHCKNCLCRFCGQADESTDEGRGGSSLSLSSCEQCGGKYHEVCRPDVDVTSIDANCSDLSFCGKNCKMIFEQLQSHIGVRIDIGEGFSCTLVRRFYDDSLDVSSGLSLKAECNSKVAVALLVMDECFLPIFDQRSGINLIPNVLYNCGSNFSRLDYRGFYTFILAKGDEIISAASVRVHGRMLAEMPFIGTRHIYRRQGMCRRLLCAIEEALRALEVEKLVIPAIPDLLHTWTSVFGFEPLTDSDYQETRKLNILVFPGTGLLKKHLLIPHGAPASCGSPTLRDKLKAKGSTCSLLHAPFQSEIGKIEHKSDVTDHDIGNLCRDDTFCVLVDSGNKSGSGSEGNFVPIPELHLIQDVCSKNDQSCKLTDGAAGANCCA